MNLGQYILNRYLYVPIFIFAGFAASVPVAIPKPIPVRSESRLKTAVLWTAVACSVVIAFTAESLHGLRALIRPTLLIAYPDSIETLGQRSCSRPGTWIRDDAIRAIAECLNVLIDN